MPTGVLGCLVPYRTKNPDDRIDSKILKGAEEREELAVPPEPVHMDEEQQKEILPR